MSRAPEPGRPSALATPFVPRSARRALNRPAPDSSRFAASFLAPEERRGYGSQPRGYADPLGGYGGPQPGRGYGGPQPGGGFGGAPPWAGASNTRRRPPPPRGPVNPGGNADAYSSTGMRERAQEDAALLAQTAPPGSGVPERVHRYYSILPLELPVADSLLPPTRPHVVAYKAVSATDGNPALLLRVVGKAPAMSGEVIKAGNAWRGLRHAGVVGLLEVFSTRVFAGADVNELVFAYAFPGRAESVAAIFLADRPRPPLPEDALWALATQLLSGVAACHARGLALRGALDPAAVLVVGRNRVSMLGTGFSDALDPAGAGHLPNPREPGAPPPPEAVGHMKGDLARLAGLLLSLALRANPAVVRGASLVAGVAGALDVLRATPAYSPDFTTLVETLVTGSTRGSSVSIRDALAGAAPQLAAELGNVHTYADGLTRALANEFDASRNFRLMALLGFVNERDDAGVSDHWSETGDRYVLKLFRDYVFHRVDPETNAPLLDMGHVAECLHKLDMGVPDQVLLASRDNVALIISSFRDLRRCLMASVDELIALQNSRNRTKNSNMR